VRGAQEAAALAEQIITAGVDAGLLMRSAEDETFDGRTIRLAGRPRLNFGSCGYLGLELDPRLRAAVCAAVSITRSATVICGGRNSPERRSSARSPRAIADPHRFRQGHQEDL